MFPPATSGYLGPPWRRPASGPAADDVVDVAPRLLGWRLTHRTPEGVVTIELTEVEAYAGERDPASHAGRGRTPRNAIMYGPAGRLYVYFSYGMHWCANLVVGPEGAASAVLLRAGRVVEGADLARVRRGPRISGPGPCSWAGLSHPGARHRARSTTGQT